MPREILGDSNNCFVQEVRCAHLRGRNWCELLKGNVNSVPNVDAGIKHCPGFFLSLDQLKQMDFKTMIPLLSDADPMQKLNAEAIQGEASISKIMHDAGISPHYDRDFSMKSVDQLPLDRRSNPWRRSP